MAFVQPIAVPSGADLKALREAHDVPRATMADLIGVSESQLSDWEDGAPLPPAFTQSVQSACRMVRLASFSAWKQRVAAASGVEILLDRDLRIAALSKLAINTPFPELKFDVPASLFLGAHIHRVLPGLDCKLVVNHGTGLNDLYEIGFFDGRVRFVRIMAEINFGRYAYCGAFEYWPVGTCDAGTVVRQVSIIDLDRRTVLKKPGILVERTEIARV